MLFVARSETIGNCAVTSTPRFRHGRALRWRFVALDTKCPACVASRHPFISTIDVETFERCSMMNKRSKVVAVGASAAIALGALAGCSGDGGNSYGKVTLTWWHNGTGEPLL